MAACPSVPFVQKKARCSNAAGFFIVRDPSWNNLTLFRYREGVSDGTRFRRSQRDYSLAFKLSVVEQVEKGELTYKQAQRATEYKVGRQFWYGVANTACKIGRIQGAEANGERP